MAALFCVPTSCVWGFQSFHVLTNSCQCLFPVGRPSGGDVVSPCSFSLHFPDDCWLWAASRALSAVHIPSLVKADFKFACFQIGWFVLWLSCKSCLCILGFKSFVACMKCRYFLPFSALCFHLVMMSFEAQRFLVLMMPSVSVSFIACAFGVVSKKSLPTGRSWRYTCVS